MPMPAETKRLSNSLESNSMLTLTFMLRSSKKMVDAVPGAPLFGQQDGVLRHLRNLNLFELRQRMPGRQRSRPVHPCGW